MARVQVTMLLMVITMTLVSLSLSENYAEEGSYQWPRTIRGPPSMRLRFGKRQHGVWGLSQRSLPSLRMRFGKRTSAFEPEELDSFQDILQSVPNTDEVVGPLERRDGAVVPGMRMRFGKRETQSGENEWKDQ